MKRYAVIEKAVGETPLVALERYRATDPELSITPMAYAGRLDPMASGKLLILIGDECKRQQDYHALDKEYQFEMLLGLSSDTGDVLGLITPADTTPTTTKLALDQVAKAYSKRTVSLPYPHFSAKTVQGKPLHVWTLEGRLAEIEIPVATTKIHRLRCTSLRYVSGATLAEAALQKIETIPTVTDASKALGADFRRVEVRAGWKRFSERYATQQFPIATFTCVASAGTYMRSLAEHLGTQLDTSALAFSIHRTKIGRYRPLLGVPLWQRP